MMLLLGEQRVRVQKSSQKVAQLDLVADRGASLKRKQQPEQRH